MNNEIAPGTWVRSNYRGTKVGVVLERYHPFAWANTLAFSVPNPDPEAVKAHVAQCEKEGLLTNRMPVLWYYRDGRHVHWCAIERLQPIARPSSAVARQVPEALNWDWYMVKDADGTNEQGPFIMTQAEVAADLAAGRCVKPYPRHDRPTVHIGTDHAEQRYPRLCAALSCTGYFTWGEAAVILRDYMRGMDFAWWGRKCSQIIPEELKERHQPHRKKGMQQQLARYRSRVKNNENPQTDPQESQRPG